MLVLEIYSALRSCSSCFRSYADSTVALECLGATEYPSSKPIKASSL
jgi:hypothetical protein